MQTSVTSSSRAANLRQVLVRFLNNSVDQRNVGRNDDIIRIAYWPIRDPESRGGLSNSACLALTLSLDHVWLTERAATGSTSKFF